MRIAQVAPLYEAVPPGTYGGTERVIAGLCDGLVAQGHEVTLGRTGEAGVAYLVLGKIGYIGKGIAIAIVGGLMLVGALTRDESQSGNLDHALRTLLTYPFGQTLVVVIAAGMLCFGIFCLARARHLSRAHVRTTAPISPSPVSPNHRRRT